MLTAPLLPISTPVLLREIEQGTGQVREPLDEPVVEVCEAQEGLHFLPVRWSRPFRYSSYLEWVHLNRILGNNHSEVLHFCLLELALFGFKEEVVFPEQLHNSPSDPPVLL